jgi:IS5 family transposase
LFRERLTRATLDGRPAIEALVARFDAALRAAGYIAMSGQILGSSPRTSATLVTAPHQCNTAAEKAEIKAGRVPAEWQARPAKLRHKDRDARWTAKVTKAKPDAQGTSPATDLAIPVFGYQSHVGIRRFGLIRTWAATDAAAHEGRMLREGLLDNTNTASAVWADTAYRSKRNEHFLAENGFVSRIHRRKPAGRPMPVRTARANGAKSKVRARIEHVFAEQKSRMGLFIRTVGLARARTKIGLANLIYNVKRLIVLERKGALPTA